MNFKHMDFQKKTMLALVVLLIVILVYAVAFAAPVRRKNEECQEELVQTERQIREQKDLSENKRWIEQEMDGLPFRMEELPEYNNQKHEMKELKEIFDGIPGYGLEFQTEKINEMLMTRDVTVTCEISGIEELEEITGKIEHGDDPALILETVVKRDPDAGKDIFEATPSEVSGPEKENENYSCMIRIRFFEKVSK